MTRHAEVEIVARQSADRSRSASRGPIPRDEYVRRIREAVNADYTALQSSPLCELPGVVALARTTYSRKIFPTASALRALLDRAYANAIEEVSVLDDHRMRQVATYLRLAREGKSVTAITRELGRRSRSHVHTDIQREAFEILTAAFLQLARDAAASTAAGQAQMSSASHTVRPTPAAGTSGAEH